MLSSYGQEAWIWQVVKLFFNEIYLVLRTLEKGAGWTSKNIFRREKGAKI